MCAAVGFAGTAAAQDQLKVAVVDVGKIFSGYYKVKETEKLLAETRGSTQRESEARMEHHHRLLEEIARLDKDLNNPALDAPAKADRQTKRQGKIEEIHSLEQELRDFKAGRDHDMQELTTRLRNQIIEDIMVVVRAQVESKHYDLILNKSAQGGGGRTLVLNANANLEITDEVITALNRNRPGAKPAASPEP